MSVIIQSSLLLSLPEAMQPLTHARIGYRSILTRDNISGTSGTTEFPLLSVVNPATFERYQPTSSPAIITVDAGSAVPVDYFGLEHVGVSSAELEYSDDGSEWNLAIDVAPANNTVMGLFEEIEARYWRLRITGSGMQVIALKIGKALAMQRPIYGGHSPTTLSRVTSVRPSVSETGQWLGATEVRRGLTGSYSWQHLSASWYREEFDPFVATNPQVRPFFLAWRPLSFPAEVAYCWATNDIRPSNMGIRDLMQVDMTVEGYRSAGT